jgi:hypothetical protein
MIRTRWLGLACLIALVAMAALRFVVTKSSAENVSSLLPPATAQPDPAEHNVLIKGDRLPLFHRSEQPSSAVVATRSVIASEPPAVPVKIIARHWHDPFAKQMVVKPRFPDVKPKTAAR